MGSSIKDVSAKRGRGFGQMQTPVDKEWEGLNTCMQCSFRILKCSCHFCFMLFSSWTTLICLSSRLSRSIGFSLSLSLITHTHNYTSLKVLQSLVLNLFTCRRAK